MTKVENTERAKVVRWMRTIKRVSEGCSWYTILGAVGVVTLVYYLVTPPKDRRNSTQVTKRIKDIFKTTG